MLCLNSGRYFDVLYQLLAQDHIRSKLPRQFVQALPRREKHNDVATNLNRFAEAFKGIGNPVVIVKLREHRAKISCPDAVSVDMRMTPCIKDIVPILFPKTTKHSQGDEPTVDRGLTSTSNNRNGNVTDVSSDADQKTSSNHRSLGKSQIMWTLIEDTLNLKSAENKTDADNTRISTDVLKIKVMLIEKKFHSANLYIFFNHMHKQLRKRLLISNFLFCRWNWKKS